MNPSYSIKEVRNSEGVHFLVEEILSKPENEINRIRTLCFQAHKEKTSPPYVCGYCLQPVWLPATLERIHHFKHFSYKGIEKCPYYSGDSIPIKVLKAIRYNGAKEGPKHIRFKELILRSLNLNSDVSNLQSEKVISLPKTDESDYKRQWRKPDINGSFKNIDFAIELQLSTTWLNEIIGRTIFYRKIGFYLIWVFDKFYPEYTNRELAYSDVFCNNNENAFVFDEECFELSKQSNDLILKCYFNKYIRDGFTVQESCENKVIAFSDLTFSHNLKMVYYHDSLGEQDKLLKQIELELNKIADDSEKELQEHIKNERNKDYDQRIQEVKNHINKEQLELIALQNQLKETEQSLSENENDNLDQKSISEELLAGWINNEDRDNNFTNLTDKSRFIQKINQLKVNFTNDEKKRDFLGKVLNELKIISVKKIQNKEYALIPRHSNLFAQLYQSIFYVKRIELETSILKPLLQKIDYQQLRAAFINNQEFVFVMLKSDVERHRRELSKTIQSIQTVIDYSGIRNEIETVLNRSRDNLINRKKQDVNLKQKQISLLQKKIEEYFDQLKIEEQRKINYNTPFEF